MVRPLLIVGCLLLAALPVRAQSQKADAFVGYQFTKFEVTRSTIRASGNGWDAALGYNVNDWAGVKVDVSGSYSSGGTLFSTVTTGPVNLYTYTFGPVFSVPNQQVRPFVEFLAGGYRDYNQYFSNSAAQGMALMAGGGVDAQVAKHFAWRLEADWLGFMSGYTSGSGSKTNFRFSTGLVIRF